MHERLTTALKALELHQFEPLVSIEQVSEIETSSYVVDSSVEIELQALDSALHSSSSVIWEAFSDVVNQSCPRLLHLLYTIFRCGSIANEESTHKIGAIACAASSVYFKLFANQDRNSPDLLGNVLLDASCRCITNQIILGELPSHTLGNLATSLYTFTSAPHCNLSVQMDLTDPLLAACLEICCAMPDGEVCHKATQAVINLCDPRHGNVGVLLHKILKQLLVLATRHCVAEKNVESLQNFASYLHKHCKAVYGNELDSHLLTFCQHLCMAEFSRAGSRDLASQLVIFYAEMLPLSLKCNFVRFLTRLSRNKQMLHRHNAIASLQGILLQSWIWPPESSKIDNYPNDITIEDTLVQALQSLAKRIQDKNSSIRAAAIHSICSIIKHVGSRNLVSLRYLDDICSAAASGQETDISLNTATPGANKERHTLLTIMMRRLDDEKAIVRKAAVDAIAAIGCQPSDQQPTIFRINELGDYVILLISSRCTDSSLSVRKASIGTLSAWIMGTSAPCAALREAWLCSIPTLAQDTEKSVQTKALQSFEDVFMKPLTQENCTTTIAWTMVSDTLHHSGIRESIIMALNELSSKQLTTEVCRHLQQICRNHPMTNHAAIAWGMIAIILESNQMNVISTKTQANMHLAKAAVDELCKDNASARSRDLTLAHSLIVCLRHYHHLLPADTLLRSCKYIMDFILYSGAVRSAAGAKAVSAGINFLSTVALRDVEHSLLPSAQKLLGAYATQMQRTVSDNNSDATAMTLLYAVGELIQSACQSNGDSGHNTSMERTSISSDLKLSVQALALPSFSGTSHQVPSSVRAHATIALGKLCLVDDAFARSNLKFLVQELLSPWSANLVTPPEVRNNILMVLADLCSRYPGLVEPFIPHLVASTRDPHTIVRRQSILVVTSLLQQDYLKWHPSIIFRFCCALVDADDVVRQLSLTALNGPLKARSPDLLVAHFSDFVLTLLGASVTFEEELQQHPHVILPSYSLHSSDASAVRTTTYKRVLTLLTPEQRLSVQVKLIANIISPITDGSFTSAKVPNDEIIGEVLQILGLPEMFNAQAVHAGDETESTIEQGLAEAKGKLLAKMAQKHMLEHALPTLLRLRDILTEQKSPILRELMSYLGILWRLHKRQLTEIFASDHRLISELEFDARKTLKKSTNLGLGIN